MELQTDISTQYGCIVAASVACRKCRAVVLSTEEYFAAVTVVHQLILRNCKAAWHQQTLVSCIELSFERATADIPWPPALDLAHSPCPLD